MEEIGLLWKAFRMEAVVIMPDPLHCIWTLPPEDADFSIRWSLLKGHFSRSFGRRAHFTQPDKTPGVRNLAKPVLAHLLTDQNDFNSHLDYLHWNPVKHGWVRQVADWPHSSFHRFVELGVYPLDWEALGRF